MKKINITKMIALISAITLSGSVFAQIAIWSEDFTGFAAPTDYLQGVGIFTYGFDGDDNASFDSNLIGGTDNVKALTSGLWGKNGAASTAWGFNDIGGGNIAAQPAVGAGSMRGMGVFLGSNLFTAGTGTYTLSYDVIADSGAINKNTRIWIGTSSTHDGTATNGWGLDVADVNLSNPDSPWLTSGSTIVSTTVSVNINTSVSSTGNTLTFSYTDGEDVAIVLGSVNSDMAFDNLSITAVPEPATFALLAGLATLGLVMYRRRKA